MGGTLTSKDGQNDDRRASEGWSGHENSILC
jgi:hypothetical protein